MRRSLEWIFGLGARWFARSVRLAIICSGVFSAVALGTPFSATASEHASASCTAAQYRQFDFWLGDWDVFETRDGTKVAHVRVSSILNGCVLLEEYQDSTGYQGQSFSLYDATRDVWHQSWVTNRGQLLAIEGNFRAKVMEMAGTDLAAASSPKRWVRVTWQVTDAGVHELAVRSTDEGKSWTPWFDLLFRPRSK